jgi:hypothetical protein
MAIKLHHYTGNWQPAMRPTAPRKGSHVLVPETDMVDGREWDDFNRLLRRNGLAMEFLRAKNSKWNVYEVVEREVEW